MRNFFESNDAPRPVGPYSQVIEANGFVFTSGIIGLNPETGELEGYDEEQTERAMMNLENLLIAAGTSVENVVKTQVYIKDMAKFNMINEIYSRHFKEPFPARVLVEVSSLPRGALVEIAAVAVK